MSLALDHIVIAVHNLEAAIADYRKDKAEVCPHATAALAAFSRAGAKRLLEGPADLARANKCVIPPDILAPGDA